MTYNIHPILVHFPIALLTVYSIIQILLPQKWFPAIAWKHIERTLLFFGVLGAYAALSTGELAEQLSQPDHDLVEMHSLFATIATWIYSILLAGEILSVLTPWITLRVQSVKSLEALLFLKRLLTHPTLSTILALLGLVTISITGLLGGVMVYGTSADPLSGIVLKVLGITL